MEINSVPLKGKEYLYTYRNSQQISSQTGLIGYVRADMGTLGTEFFSTWNGFRDDLNTQDFKDDIDTVINSLRKDGGFLSNRDQLEDFCINSDNVFAYNTGVDYGVRVNTKEYAFLMRLNPYKGNYNLYCYCYKKGWLDHHLEKAERGIRFIDSRYNEKFRLEDGDEIIIKSTEEKDTVRDTPARYVCRYIDDYHFEYGINLRHICEFAELCERTGNTVIPLRASLPNQCYVFVQSENKIGIATGDYDAIIIGHSQFEKIPMSIERQRALIEQQIDDITDGIAELKANKGENFSIKQLEKSRKSLQTKLKKLNDQSRKDDVVTFEELGVDRLFIDESHFYKNLFLATKMRNVGGIAQTEAQKSSDLFMKCRYLDELTGGRGTVFATGTPISNSMVELYTIQRYLQYNTLLENGLQHFDAWASTFGETVTAYELKPEGTGYRTKTRFAKFYNLPELMAMFKQVADIRTADTLNLPTPTPHYHNVAVKPSDYQKEMVESFAERADKVRGGSVDPSVDNMLKITNDGRKLALDQRMISPMLPDFEGSKINACFQIRNEYMVDHSNLLIAVYNGEAGGTRNTINYAKKKDIEIIVVEG